MKALVIHMAHFRLPDNFNGTVSDAFRLLADYHDSVEDTPHQSKQVLPEDFGGEIGELSMREASTQIFERFIEQVIQGRRMVGLVQLADYNPQIPMEPLA